MLLGKDLIPEFRTQADDKKKPYLWGDTSVANWFNEAEREACIRAKLILDSDTFSVNAGELSLDLPALLHHIQYVELIAADGKRDELSATSRRVLDFEASNWRNTTERPDRYIHDQSSLTFSALPDADYEVYIEFFRLPAQDMGLDDEPEIPLVHQDGLVDWVLFRAFSVPDADGFDPKRSAMAEEEFTKRFGPRPGADMRRRQQANRPHRNRAHL